jgi:hypothetical protein
MANRIRYFREVLTIPQHLITSLRAYGGDTVVFGAREMTLLSLCRTRTAQRTDI